MPPLKTGNLRLMLIDPRVVSIPLDLWLQGTTQTLDDFLNKTV